MGTINFKTSDYITMGYKLPDEWDLERDPLFMRDIKEEVDEYGGTVEEAIANYINGIEEAWEEAGGLVDQYSFDFFLVSLEPGYYESFYLMIENNLPAEFDDDQEKADAAEDVKNIARLLTGLAFTGLVSVYPGWRTGYATFDGTLKDIRKAVKAMAKEIAATPVYQEAETAIA